MSEISNNLTYEFLQHNTRTRVEYELARFHSEIAEVRVNEDRLCMCVYTRICVR